MADDVRHLASSRDDRACEVTAELARQLAERARASRFQRYRDRAKQLAARAPTCGRPSRHPPHSCREGRHLFVLAAITPDGRIWAPLCAESSTMGGR
jgi:hypothetical protein